MKYVFLMLLLASCVFAAAIAQNAMPFYYWSFNGPQAGKDQITGKLLDTNYYKCKFSEIKGTLGKAIDLNDVNCLVVTGAMKPNVTDEFTIEFLFRGSDFTFLSFSQQSLLIHFGYNGFSFRTTTTLGGKSVTDHFQVPLTGAGRRSYNYYTDDNWHHLVFTASLKTGKKEIWVDGECPEGFSQSIQAGKDFEFGASDGFRNTSQIDELAFYKQALPAALIRQHYTEMQAGKPYSFIQRKSRNASFRKSASIPAAADPREFAPGYPAYTVQATGQLKSFPLPRYNPAVPVKRNMSWMDISYLHRELPHQGGKGFGKVNPAKAVELTEEMAKHWNYYLDIPVLRTTAEAADQKYANKGDLHGALIDFANRHPQYPVATILIEAQVRPEHAGFSSPSAYVTAQDLPVRYYLNNGKGEPVIRDNRKWLSPLMPMDIIEKDGLTSRFYVHQLLRFLNRPPALINENGEVFGHIRAESLLKQDPVVWVQYQKSGLSAAQYSGRFQYRMDAVYRAAIMKGFNPGSTHFSFYNVSAFNPAYWPDYAMRRELNRWDKQTVYPTPDFYPRWPDNWQNARGAFNGYGTVARGRVTEIALGDRFFTPFVSAGWDEEEKNIRPAQWLALLKAMVMLGADFFYTGYFNVTGSGGKWPNGAGPNDPRGYAYQIAMPTYAQAIRTWVPKFFEKGELMNPADSTNLTHQYRFKGRGENELILVRKLGKKYLIYGSIQPNSNIKGNVPQSKNTTIELEGDRIIFEIRRQGSMYVLDRSGDSPVFYQLDSWHQYEHPYYWDKAVVLEAETEVSFSNNSGVQIRTEAGKGGANNFSNYTSFVIIPKGEPYLIPVFIRQGNSLAISIRARAGKAGGKIKINVGDSGRTIRLRENSWETIDAGKWSVQTNSEEPVNVQITILDGTLELDKITLSTVK